MMNDIQNNQIIRARIHINGAVQGVGFRPFIYRLAISLNLKGWVINSSQGVDIEAEGPCALVTDFILRIEHEKPVHARIHSFEHVILDPVNYDDFLIRKSDDSGLKTAVMLPDIATCADCLTDIFDPQNRRYLYPFTNCTNCGPRFTIIENLPYDRANTSMKIFTMCAACRKEYDDPADRRFHAQPNACPVCGPHLELWDNHGCVVNHNHGALLQTVESLQNGHIVAVKGIGGFHLLVNALDDAAVQRLRKRKNREEKPFALMYPDMAAIMLDCLAPPPEQRLLRSPECPIVLLEKMERTRHRLSSSIAPDNPYLGVMLPYSPLHHILMRELKIPVVATSGNVSDEPICIDEQEALIRLKSVADYFLIHNRPIVRHADDSVARVMAGREMIMRRARGHAPLPVLLKRRFQSGESTVLAVGGHLKNTIAINRGDAVFISQHIGDLETVEAESAFRNVIADFKSIYELTPAVVACDLHPDYQSTRFAYHSGLTVKAIQHHYAHVLSCMAENELDEPVLGIAWDGTGYGTDHTIWGGEFLIAENHSFRRIAHFRPFILPGGAMAVKEPCRTALGILYEIFKDNTFKLPGLIPLQHFNEKEILLIRSMLNQNTNCPVTTSAGRLFDGVASIIGLNQIIRHEGQAAMALEFAAQKNISAPPYPFHIMENNASAKYVVDWEPIILAVVEDTRQNISAGQIADKFHKTLSEIILQIAQKVALPRVALSGGCFQNKLLLEYTVDILKKNQFQPYWHQCVPPNDGGISLGQLAAVRNALS